MSNPFHDEKDAKSPDGEKMVVYVCEHCGERFEAAETDVARAVDCPHCGEETILGGKKPDPEPERTVVVEDPVPSNSAAPEPGKHTPVTVNVVSAPGHQTPAVQPQPLPAPRLKPGGALVECGDCGGVMNRRADACPICGRPRKTRRSLFYYVFVGTMSFALSLAFLLGVAYVVVDNLMPGTFSRVSDWVGGRTAMPAPAVDGGAEPDTKKSRMSQTRPETDEEAVAEFEAALTKARGGDVEAQQYVGYCYFVGQGTGQDDHEAFSWYFKAALQGSPVAQSHLASMFVEGRGVPQDYNEALRYYKKAAEQGLAEAQFNLGVLYDKGLGVTQNYKEAFRWYFQAADRGDVNAQLSVAMMHFQGQGANLDLVQALKWAILASSQGHEGAEELRRALTESDNSLMPDQVAQAQREAAEFMERKKKAEAEPAKG